MKSWICISFFVFGSLSQIAVYHRALHATPETSTKGECGIVLNRNLDAPKSYGWTCNCDDADGEGFRLVGRVEVLDPPGAKNSAAQVRATTRCALRQNATLTRDCREDPVLFEKRATRVLGRCLLRKPRRRDRKKKGPFTVDRSLCEAIFTKNLTPGSTAGVWICVCSLRRFRVVLARAPFSTTGSPIGARKEALFLETCAQSSQKRLNRLCKRRLEDFKAQANRSLQRCCKKARRNVLGGSDRCDIQA